MEKINFYKDDEAMSWVAATTFTDEHHGSAISDDELEYRKELKELVFFLLFWLHCFFVYFYTI